MNKGIKTKLYFESLVFLFLIEGIINFQAYTLAYYSVENIALATYHIAKNNYFSMIMFLLFLIDAVILVRGVVKNRTTEMPDRKECCKARIVHEFSYSLFCMTYILPMASICLLGFKGKVFTLIWLVLLGLISVNSSLYYRNPVLVALGYHVYKEYGKGVTIIVKVKDSIRYTFVEQEINHFIKVFANPKINDIESKNCLSRDKIIGKIGIAVAKLIKEGKEHWPKVKKWITKHPFVVSLLCSTIISGIMIARGLVRWESTDDFSMSQLLMGTSGEPTPFACFISYYLGVVVVWLQTVLPIINWLTGLEILSVWIAFTIMQWFLMKYGQDKAVWIEIFFCIAFEPLFLMNLQYTRSAFILPFAGYLLIFDACIGRLRVDEPLTIVRGEQLVRKISEITAGLFLCIAGSFFRNYCFYGGAVYIAILVFTFTVSGLKRKSQKKHILLV